MVRLRTLKSWWICVDKSSRDEFFNWTCRRRGAACKEISQLTNRNARKYWFCAKICEKWDFGTFLWMTSAWRQGSGPGTAGWCGDAWVGWLGRMTRRTRWISGEMAVDIDADLSDDVCVGTDSGKRFYRTAYYMGVVIVSGCPTQ